MDINGRFGKFEAMVVATFKRLAAEGAKGPAMAADAAPMR